jgi:hypothetical protein
MGLVRLERQSQAWENGLVREVRASPSSDVARLGAAMQTNKAKETSENGKTTKVRRVRVLLRSQAKLTP